MLAASRYCLVLQKPAHQLLTGVLQLIFDFILAWQHHARLDLDQRAGHFQKIADRIDVELFQHSDVTEVLLGDYRNGEVRDVQLMLTDQIEQQIHRTVIRIELNTKASHTTGRFDCAKLGPVRAKL